MGQGERTISRICEQPNIFHSILIFVPNILGGRGIQNTEIKKYSCCLSALRPRFKSEGGKGDKAISGMCVQPNIFHLILIFVPTHLGVDLKYRNTEIQLLSREYI